MKLIIAGKDRTQDLAPELTKAALARTKDPYAPKFCSEEDGALSLRSARGEGEYLARAISLMLDRSGLGIGEFVPGEYDGMFRRALHLCRRIIWRVIRYQPQSLVFHQNTINVQLAGAIEFLRSEYTREIGQLQGRIGELERQLAAKKPGGN